MSKNSITSTIKRITKGRVIKTWMDVSWVEYKRKILTNIYKKEMLSESKDLS